MPAPQSLLALHLDLEGCLLVHVVRVGNVHEEGGQVVHAAGGAAVVAVVLVLERDSFAHAPRGLGEGILHQPGRRLLGLPGAHEDLGAALVGLLEHLEAPLLLQHRVAEVHLLFVRRGHGREGVLRQHRHVQVALRGGLGHVRGGSAAALVQPRVGHDAALGGVVPGLDLLRQQEELELGHVAVGRQSRVAGELLRHLADDVDPASGGQRGRDRGDHEVRRHRVARRDGRGRVRGEEPSLAHHRLLAKEGD
mmetsp:Transcript_17575/g.66427  ORF Transcript_17575/g.66427 Transcript_17575/m.66427 type:complete len:251 (+) Transcript_17575:2824-3576(+)